ncbi:MAG: hypothetical protein HQ464_00695, partial [Planctomycetes bacterium]|nr:hypothetical protein [Planctomycetota bacterium]
MLEALKRLVPEVAAGFGGVPCSLCLKGLRTLDAPTAQQLSKHQGLLDLDGIEAIDDNALVALSHNRGPMDLGGLRKLSPIGAAALGKNHIGLL